MAGFFDEENLQSWGGLHSVAGKCSTIQRCYNRYNKSAETETDLNNLKRISLSLSNVMYCVYDLFVF